MFGIFKIYRNLLRRRAATDFNRMAAYLTNLCGDESIDLHRPDEPTADNPPCIAVNKVWIEDKIDDMIDDKIAPQAPTGTNTIQSGIGESGSQRKTDTFTASDPGGAGIVVNIITRAAYDGSSVLLWSRPFTITSDGRVYRIGAENSSTIAVYQDTSA